MLKQFFCSSEKIDALTHFKLRVAGCSSNTLHNNRKFWAERKMSFASTNIDGMRRLFMYANEILRRKNDVYMFNFLSSVGFISVNFCRNNDFSEVFFCYTEFNLSSTRKKRTHYIKMYSCGNMYLLMELFQCFVEFWALFSIKVFFQQNRFRSVLTHHLHNLLWKSNSPRLNTFVICAVEAVCCKMIPPAVRKQCGSFTQWNQTNG